MNNLDINQEGTEESTEVKGTNPGHEDKGSKPRRHWNWQKLRNIFEADSHQDTQYPMMIITVSCVIISVCMIFMTFTQLGIAKSLKRLCILQKYGFPL